MNAQNSDHTHRHRADDVPQHGDAAEPRPVPVAGNPRPGVTAGDFAFAVAIQNIVWGYLAGAGRRVGGPLRHATRDRGRRRGLSPGLGDHGRCRRRGRAEHLRRRLIGMALSCTASSLGMTATARAVPEIGAASCSASSPPSAHRHADHPASVQGLLAHWDWHVGMIFFLVLAAVMLPAAFLSGGADKLPRRGANNVTMGEALGQAVRHRGYLVMSGAYFVCGLQLVFLTDALAQLPGDLRPGSDAGRIGAGDHRRGELHRILARRLAGRASPSTSCSACST